MGRAPCCDKNGLKKGPWTPEEDLKLINYIQIHGPGNWRTLPKNAGLQRCGKSCRLRWTNYLRPDIKRGRFSFEEEETIIQLHSIMGNKWSAIAARLPGRTDNEIKNYWNTHIRKRLLRTGIDPVTHAPRLDLLEISSILRSVLTNNQSLLNLQSLLRAQALMNPQLLKLATNLLALKNQNPDLVSQNIQQILQAAGNHQVDSQASPFSQPPTQTTNMHEGLSGNITNMSCSSSSQQSSSLASYLCEDLVNPQQNQVDLQGINPSFGQCLMSNENVQSMGYESVLSTPLSSPTPLNSSSTYVSSSAEEQRDTHCSDFFKFEIPESLDISDFL
ncbi:hypothetical protein K1719_042705 [Acacia pycnantha]|nr:hypothetical protein K1719_042705 [Acacia pycnantha]